MRRCIIPSSKQRNKELYAKREGFLRSVLKGTANRYKSAYADLYHIELPHMRQYIEFERKRKHIESLCDISTKITPRNLADPWGDCVFNYSF